MLKCVISSPCGNSLGASAILLTYIWACMVLKILRKETKSFFSAPSELYGIEKSG